MRTRAKKDPNLMSTRTDDHCSLFHNRSLEQVIGEATIKQGQPKEAIENGIVVETLTGNSPDSTRSEASSHRNDSFLRLRSMVGFGGKRGRSVGTRDFPDGDFQCFATIRVVCGDSADPVLLDRNYEQRRPGLADWTRIVGCTGIALSLSQFWN